MQLNCVFGVPIKDLKVRLFVLEDCLQFIRPYYYFVTMAETYEILKTWF